MSEIAEIRAMVETLRQQVASMSARGNTRQGAATAVFTQSGHGFTDVGTPIRVTASGWVKSKADTAANAIVDAVVGGVLSADAFIAVFPGHMLLGLSGKSAGSRYYLDASTAGTVTTTAPAIAVPVYDAISANAAVLAAGSSGGDPYVLPGTAWTRLTSSPYTLTGTKKIRRFMVVGAGGGAGGSHTAQTTIGYVAATPGGSPSTALEVLSSGGGGGAGGVVIADIDCTGITTVTFSAGAAGTKGSAGSVGNNGGDTTLTVGSLALKAYGGLGGNAGAATQTGSPGAGGAGGECYLGAVVAMLKGAYGVTGGIKFVTSVGGTVWSQLPSFYSNSPVAVTGSAMGNGGGPGSDGLGGAVFIAV